MNLMLIFLFYCALVGLLANSFGRRQCIAIAAGAVVVVALYWAFPYRFM